MYGNIGDKLVPMLVEGRRTVRMNAPAQPLLHTVRHRNQLKYDNNLSGRRGCVVSDAREWMSRPALINFNSERATQSVVKTTGRRTCGDCNTTT